MRESSSPKNSIIASTVNTAPAFWFFNAQKWYRSGKSLSAEAVEVLANA